MKTSIKLLALSILTLMSLSVTVELPPVYATIDFNSDAWKNEGIFTPLTPFNSFEWSEETYTDFENQFASWSAYMEQSYYPIMDAVEIHRENEANDADIKIENHTFRGFQFKEILKNAFDDGYKVGFTYKDRDYRSDYDRNRYDVFAMYGSQTPDQKHLYIFAVNMETEEPVVFYLDGDTMYAGERFAIKETANEELKGIFYTLITGEDDNNSYTSEGNSNNIIDSEKFFQLSKEEQHQYCSITPWYELPGGYCWNRGMLPDGHWWLALQYGRETGAGIDESIAATKDQYWSDFNYYEYLITPEYYTERDGQKIPITAHTADYNGNGMLEDWEIEEAQSKHTY